MALDRTERFAREFRDGCLSTWDFVKKDYDRAMLALDLEDTVASGICALDCYLRHAEQWHEWVSEDAARYEEESHARLQMIESIALSAAKGTIELIKRVKGTGRPIRREAEFRALAEQLFGASGSDDERFNDPAFRAYANKAFDDYTNDRAEEIDSWSE